MDKLAIIDELLRVAAKLQTTGLTKRQFKEHGQIALTTVVRNFGTWNQAVEAARLDANPPGPPPARAKLSDDELLQEIIRLTQELGKQPPITEMNAKGRYSVMPYRKRWSSSDKACQAAYV